MRFLLSLLTVLTLSIPSLAQEAAYKVHSQSCVMGICTRQQGTGVLLNVKNGFPWFITAGHVLASQPSVAIGNHKYKVAKVQEWQTGGILPDKISLLRTTEETPKQRLASYPIPETRKPKEGDRVWLVGFPNGRYVVYRSHITEVQSAQFLTRHHLASGASGGAVVYQDTSELAGIIHGFDSRTQEGIATRSDWIRTQLAQEFDYLLPKPRPPPPKPDPLPPVQPPPEPVPPVEAPEPPQRPSEPPVGPPTPQCDPTLGPRIEALEKDVQEIKGALAPLASLNEDMASLKEDLIINQNDGLQKLGDSVREERNQVLGSFAESLGLGIKDLLDQQRIELEAKINASRPPELPPPSSPPPDEVPPGDSDNGSSGSSPLGGLVGSLPWMAILTGLGISIPGGALGLGLLWAGRGAFRYLTRPKPQLQPRKGNADAGPPPPTFHRDTDEAEQILNLRQHEQREPLQDAMHGVLWEDELRSNPSRTLEEAHQSVLARFNSIFPLSSTEVKPE